MPSLASVISRASVLAALLLGLSGCSSAPHGGPSGPELQPLSKSERVAHVLSRLTFGARPVDAERVAALGVDRWIEQQLRPAAIPDSVVVLSLARIPSWRDSASRTPNLMQLPTQLAGLPLAQQMKDTAAVKMIRVRLVAPFAINDFFYAGRIIRAQESERQLLQVLTDFWENHFSVFTGKMPSTEALSVWDREVLHPNALGKFRDLLGATAHSPAMLFYLDNHLSKAQGLNENYARELLELHTLGVDGGYTQQDVIEVARALTGWTIRRTPAPAVFMFRREQHDPGTKVVLGHTLASGRGIEDGEEVLDILARHPSTARYISLKLARRLVSDDPPPALVDRAAATFLRTDGDIAEVVRTIVTSREFFSRQAFRAKVKTPHELVISAWRALGARADTSPATSRLITQLGQGPFAWATPEGFPEKGAAWINSGTIFKRVKFGRDLAGGSLAYARPERWSEWSRLSALPLDEQVEGVVKNILGGVADSTTRSVMLGIRSDNMVRTAGAADGAARLRELLAIALASPEFQRR
jgi:uncharacterized protein (DUF1800 family)